MALELTPPRDLPAASSVSSSESLIVDNGSAVRKATPKQVVDAGRPVASQAEAIAGTSNTTAMTPLTTAQALAIRDQKYIERSDLVSAIAGGDLDDIAEGSIVSAAGLDYLKMPAGHALYGTDPISDMPGYIHSGEIDVRHYGVKHDGTDDVDAAQAAINTAYALGGLTVNVYDDMTVGATSEAGSYYEPSTNSTLPLSDAACLVLKSGVMLAVHNGATITSDDTTKTPVFLMDMDGGGFVGVGKLAGVTANWVASGAGHGVKLRTSAAGGFNKNLVIQYLHIHDVGSYGIAAQEGDYFNNKIGNLLIEDTGADAIDYKVRDGQVDPSSRGSTFENIVTRRHGRRSGITGSAGIDIRGPATLNNIWVLDFALAGQNTAGIRFSAGIANGNDIRETSAYSALTNFYIDSGDPSVEGMEGLVLLSSYGTNVSTGTIRNCREKGLVIGNASSGYGVSEFANMHGISIEGCWDTGVEANEGSLNLFGVTVSGAVDRFQEEKGNLEAGQTTFNCPRPFDTSTVQVYLNGTLQTLTTHYTITDTDTIEMVSGVSQTDVLLVVTPTVLGFDINDGPTALFGARTQYCTTDKSYYSTSGILEFGCDFGGAGYVKTLSGSTPSVRADGPDADYELEMHSKGTSALGARNGNGRLFRASNEANSVNWPQLVASATGNEVKLVGVGSDGTIDVKIEPKSASGRVMFGTHAAISTETVTGYIEIKDAGGTLRKLAVVS